MDQILIVDDNVEFGESLILWFKDWSFNTQLVTTVVEAQKSIMGDGPFRLVVCDFQLPDGNGLELFSWLRWDRHNPVRFLMISGSTNFVRYRPADFSFLRKPFTRDELRLAVEALLGMRLEKH
jgi:DNA-binding response OmpR family regulator